MTEEQITHQLDTFFSQFKAFSFKTDDILIKSGQQITHIFYLKSGVIKQTATSPDGQELVLTMYKNGAFFPLIWAVKEAEVPHDFRAVTNGHGWSAPKQDVIAFLKNTPEVTYSLTLRLLSGLEGLSRKAEYALLANAHLRICESLVTLAYRFGKKDGTALAISFPLTHQELAEMTGLTRETVTRELKGLKEKQLIIVEDHQVTIPDLVLLEAELHTQP